ncbi:MAG TPA: hypothetical protein VG942_13555 [Hyphomonadaceae bacterium]|nr:hypothetical protein [Hyphomonadaceae bacterium]
MLCYHRALRLAAACSVLAFAPMANAQTVEQVAAQTLKPPAADAAASQPVYVPTSLALEAGVPRTPDGHPDFQGAVWAANYFPVFEATPMSTKLVVSEAEGKNMIDMMVKGFLSNPDPNLKIDPEVDGLLGGSDGLPLVRGERRTRMVVLPATGKLPLTPEARKEVSAASPFGNGKVNADNPEQRPLGERCIVLNGQPPFATPIGYSRFEIIQTPTQVVIHSEQGDELRIVSFADTHKPQVQPSYFGNSIARWDGDTLVVETKDQPARTRLRTLPSFIVNADSTVIERFTRVSNDELLYQFSVVDPAVYTAPWLAEYSFHKASNRMFESSCHEANYSLPNILSGARVADTRGAAAKN